MLKTILISKITRQNKIQFTLIESRNDVIANCKFLVLFRIQSKCCRLLNDFMDWRLAERDCHQKVFLF